MAVQAAAEVAARDGFAPMVLTTQNIGGVAADTLDAALRGKPVYIPGQSTAWCERWGVSFRLC